MNMMFVMCASTPGKLKSLPDHGGIEPGNFGLLVQCSANLSYEVKSVRVDDISELSLVPSFIYKSSISYYSSISSSR